MAKLSERTRRISGSSTQAVTTLVDRLRRSGVQVIDFGAGEPDFPTVEVDTFDGLLVDYVAHRRADVIVRGLRAVSDYEFEFQMALMNRRLNATIETVFMMPAEQYTYISSRLIKEVFALGGRVHGLVPELVEARLRDKVPAGVRGS